MAEELLDRITRELRERKEAARAAYDESLRLQAALDALDDARGAPPEAPARSRRAGSAPPASTGARAPRGENRRRILVVVGERPGASAGEVASVTGIDRPVAASTLAKLARDGEVQRVDRPAGGVGFRLPAAPSVFDAPAEAAGDVVTGGGERQPSTAGADTADGEPSPEAEAGAEAQTAEDAAPAEGDAD